MKKLENYKRNGYEFNLVSRGEKYGMFLGDKQGITQFEIIEILSHNGREIAGNYCEATEYPPSNEQWGSKGWTFNRIDLATNKLVELLNK